MILFTAKAGVKVGDGSDMTAFAREQMPPVEPQQILSITRSDIHRIRLPTH